jgi:hypothetical protein
MVLPYLKGFVYILVFSVLVNGLLFIIGLFLKYIFRLFRYLTSGIRLLVSKTLVQEKENHITGCLLIRNIRRSGSYSRV